MDKVAAVGDGFRAVLWAVCRWLLFRPFAGPLFKGWRRFVLRCFGAHIGQGSVVHASACVAKPWNLTLGQRTCIGPHTTVNNLAPITLGSKVCVSQYATLDTVRPAGAALDDASAVAGIDVGDYAWIAARAYVGPGVTVGQWAVVGATAVVVEAVEPYAVVGGNPARFIKQRVIRQQATCDR